MIVTETLSSADGLTRPLNEGHQTVINPAAGAGRLRHRRQDNRPNVRELFRKMRTATGKYCRGLCAKKTLRRHLPITSWLPQYTWGTLVADLLAGITVGLTAIPQGIAYAVVAGLEPQYGLYSGFMGCFVYLILGSTKDVTIGPTAIMALMVQSAVSTYGSDAAVLLTFLSGCIIFILGVLHLGFLVDFISIPVVVGFTSASAVTIACSQLKPLLGIKGKSNEFLDTWIEVSDHIGETKYQDLCLGLGTIFALVLVKILNDKVQAKYKQKTGVSKGEKILTQGLRIFNVARNAVVVIFGIVLAYIFSLNDMEPFVLTGNITGGMPPFELPPFQTIRGNQTVSFSELTGSMGASALSVPLIAVLESIAIAKAFAKGKSLDATQEMLALGVSNILGSFVRSMPTTGSFTRTAVNNASGVRTPLGGIFTGALVLAALSLTSTFYFIPKATLAGLIIAAMFYMIEYHEVLVIWKTNAFDLLPFFATFFGCLFLGLDYGILIGIAVNLAFVLYHSARPAIVEEQQKLLNQEVVLIRPDQSLIYPSAEYMRKCIMKSCQQCDGDTLIVIDGQNIHSIDTTVAKNIKTLTQDLSLLQQSVVFWRWRDQPRNACAGVDYELDDYFCDADSLDSLVIEKRTKA